MAKAVVFCDPGPTNPDASPHPNQQHFVFTIIMTRFKIFLDKTFFWIIIVHKMNNVKKVENCGKL